MLAVGLLYMIFIMLRYIPSVPTLLRVFIMNVCWILSNSFSASIEVIMWFLSFVLLMWCFMLIDLQILNYPCIPGITFTSSWCMILLMYCWVQFVTILLRIFASIFSRDIGLEFSFFFIWFWYQGNAGLLEWARKYSLLFSLLEWFEKNRYLLFFKCLVEFAPKEFCPGLLFVGRFLDCCFNFPTN